MKTFGRSPLTRSFLSIIYPVAALVLARLTPNNLLHLFFPLPAGFALIGPVAALGLYELSRRRELGLDLSWTGAFGVRRSASIGGILALGGLSAVIFLVWVALSQAIYVANFGYAPRESIPIFLHRRLEDISKADRAHSHCSIMRTAVDMVWRQTVISFRRSLHIR